MADEVFVLGTDPGFASFGYAVVQLLPDTERIVTVNVIRTKKDTRKGQVLASDDNFRRTRAIYSALRSVIVEHKVVALTAEAMSYPRNASVAAKMSLAWGVIASLAEEFQLPTAQATPTKIKKAVAGSNKATKEDLQNALRRRYKGEFFAFQQAMPKTMWEHGFDAVGSVVTCLDGDVLRMARGMAT